MGWWNHAVVIAVGTTITKKVAKAKLFDRKREEKLLKFKGQTVKGIRHGVCLLTKKMWAFY